MKKILSVLLCTCAGFVWSSGSGETLQHKLNALSTMSADFNQVVKAKNREVSRSSGSMALQRPGLFRWSTKEPMEQLIIADGQNMWIYDVDLEQVTQKKQEKGMGGTAALFLSGYNDSLIKDFDVTERTEGNTSVFDLKARASKENIQRIKLVFSKDKLTGLDLYDQLGQITVVKLVQIKSNLKLDNKLFQFHPPKGVDVVKQ